MTLVNIIVTKKELYWFRLGLVLQEYIESDVKFKKIP